jgi:hypothetical protein
VKVVEEGMLMSVWDRAPPDLKCLERGEVRPPGDPLPTPGPGPSQENGKNGRSWGVQTGAPQKPQNFEPAFRGFPHVVQKTPSAGPVGAAGGADGGWAGDAVFVKS